MDWYQVAAAKRASLLNAIPAEWRLPDAHIPAPSRLRNVAAFIRQQLSPLELDITDTPAHVLLVRIRAGDYSAVEVTRAFCHRAALAHQLTNCLSEVFFAPALARAAELDHHLRTHPGVPAGPLHGLPVSLKDRFNVAGLDSACGYVSWLNDPKTARDEGALVRALRAAGAVLFVKTAVPMSMLMGDQTTNNIIGGGSRGGGGSPGLGLAGSGGAVVVAAAAGGGPGSTLNPTNRLLSPGGASGGEAALLACGGSPLGWGSDIAGSVRIPCAFNALYGLRPSFGRLPGDGLATSLPGLPVAGSVVGPMARALAALVEAVRWALGAELCGCWRDAFEVVEMPWREEAWRMVRARTARAGQADGTLAFAVVRCDGEVRPQPPVRRAVEMVVRALRGKGYEVIDWDPPPHAPAANLLFQIFGSTAGQTVRQAIDDSGEPPIPQLRQWYYHQDDDEHADHQPSSTADFWRLCELRDEYRASYHRYWEASRLRTRSGRCVDGVILPVAASAAVEVGGGGLGYYGYSAIASMLDYTAGAFPVTVADREMDLVDEVYEPLSEADRENWQSYRKDKFHGAPVGLQVMGRRLQEEKVLAMMEAIEAALREASADVDVC